MCRIDNAKLWGEKWGRSAIMVRKRKTGSAGEAGNKKAPQPEQAAGHGLI